MYSILSLSQIVKDKSWTRERDRFSEKFKEGVYSFLNYAIAYADTKDDMIMCPCGFCNNARYQTFKKVWKDLHEHGFSHSYSNERWILHGEPKGNVSEQNDADDSADYYSHTMYGMNGGLDVLLNDVEASHGVDDGETECIKNRGRMQHADCIQSVINLC